MIDTAGLVAVVGVLAFAAGMAVGAVLQALTGTSPETRDKWPTLDCIEADLLGK